MNAEFSRDKEGGFRPRLFYRMASMWNVGGVKNQQ